jgi:hypothetical protein
MTAHDTRPAAAFSAGPLLVRWLGLLLALVTVLLGALSVAGSLARDGTAQRHAYVGVRRVDVDVSVESVEVRAGPDGSTALDRTISWSLGRPTITQTQDGDRLVIRSSCPGLNLGRGCSGRVRLVVPAGTDVRVRSSAGDVLAVGLTGPLSLFSSAGSVRGTDLRTPVVDASSSADAVRLQLAVPPSRVRATSSAGAVAVLLPPGPQTYRVDASSSADTTDVTVRTDPTSALVIVARSSADSVRVAYDTP